MTSGTDAGRPAAVGGSPRPVRVPEGPPRGSGAGFMVLAATGFLALSLMYMESSRLPALPGRIVADLAFLIPLTLSVVLCALAYRRSRGVEARFWLLGSSVNAVLLVSELYWLWWVVAEGAAPPPIYAPFQVLHTAAATLFLFMLATMVRLADTPAPIRLRWWLDLSAVAAVAYVIALRFVVDPLFAPLSGAGSVTHLIAAVYTAWGAMMLIGGLWILVRPGLMRWRLWERMIAVSMMIYAAGIALWPVWYVAFRAGGSSVDERSLIDVVLVLGNYLFALAAVERLLYSDQAWPMRRLGPARSVAGQTATYFALGLSVVALPVLVAAAVVAPAGSLDRSVFAVAAAVIALLAVGRTIASAMENGRLFHTTVGDPLTGLRNHRYFHERLAAELTGAERYGDSVCVLWVDVDDFGRLNRLAGHAAGDDLLRTVAAALESCRSEDDVACRVGADEFAVIARGADPAVMLSMAERLGAALRGSVADGANAPTVSGGIACYPSDGDDPVLLAGIAERTAAWARHGGKGRVLVHEAGDGDPISEDGLAEIEERSRLGTLRALAAAVDARRETSGTRSASVAALSGALARQLGLDGERVRLIEAAALVHDVGMVSLSDSILAKEGPLSAEETEEMRRHPAIGEQIVGASAPPAVAPWIRHHHERWDGQGYPDGLRAVAIPLESRILAVCDAWDAMISDRPYRRAMNASEAVAELRAGAGSQFDPELVEPLVRLVEAFHRL